MGERQLIDILAAVLDDEDCVNLICGIPDVEAMQTVTGEYWQYYDHPSKFEWNRRTLESCSKEKLLEMYMQWKTYGQKEDNESKAEVLSDTQNKNCFFKCQKCNYNRIAKEDVFCPSCGRRLIFDKMPKVKPGIYAKIVSAATSCE